mgnify:CR=1 FL=1
MGFRIATASYHYSDEEAHLKFSKEFLEMPWVIRMDCLSDIIAEATEMYNSGFSEEWNDRKGEKKDDSP